MPISGSLLGAAPIEQKLQHIGGRVEVGDHAVRARRGEIRRGVSARGDGEAAAAVGEGAADIVGRISDDRERACASTRGDGPVRGHGHEVFPPSRPLFAMGRILTPRGDGEPGRVDARGEEFHGAGLAEVAGEEAHDHAPLLGARGEGIEKPMHARQRPGGAGRMEPFPQHRRVADSDAGVVFGRIAEAVAAQHVGEDERIETTGEGDALDREIGAELGAAGFVHRRGTAARGGEERRVDVKEQEHASA